MTFKLTRPVIALLSLLGVLGATAIMSSPASAQTVLYVAQSSPGDNSNCTSSSSPCKTVSYAITQAASGDTIDVSGHIYDNIVIPASMTITIAVSPSFQPDGPAILDGNGAGNTIYVAVGGTLYLEGAPPDLIVVQGGGQVGG